MTAPDAIVLINQNTQVVGCPTCNKSFDINKYITSIQVDLSVDSVPGSASIALSVPRHTLDDFYFDNVPVISPMMEVNIYAKGFYLVQGVPQYYPIFWGLITSVSDAYSDGAHSVSIQCADILKWWELCRMNTNPAFTSPVPSKFGISLNGNAFAGMNPFDVIWTLAQQAHGDILVGGGGLNTLTQGTLGQPQFMPALSDIMAYWQQRFQNVAKNLMMFGMTGSCVRGDVLQAQALKYTGAPPRDLASRTIRTASGDTSGGQTNEFFYNPNDAGVTAFRTNNTNLGFNAWTNEFQTKLELANAAKDAIGYEFFMDVTGDIVFKPPFYNLDILSNKPVSWIQDIDVIEWDLEESEAEVVTQLTVSGNFSGNTDWGAQSELTPFANVTDYHLLRKYGWRPAQFNSEFMSDKTAMFYYGLDLLDKMNAKRHHGTVTIPFRPEVRLGVPIYLASKDQIWYVQGVSHNISFGSRATTTLTLTAKRAKFIAPQGIGSIAMTTPPSGTGAPGPAASPGSSSFVYSGKQLSAGGKFTLKIGDAATLPPDPSALTAGNVATNPYQPLVIRNPQTGQILGYPNVVMAYVAPYYPTLATGQANMGTNPKNVSYLKSSAQPTASKNRAVSDAQQLARVDDDLTSGITAKYLTNISQYGQVGAGTFVYAHDLGSGGSTANSNAQGVFGELVLVKSGNLIITPGPPVDLDTSIANAGGQPSFTVNTATVLVRPVSDDRGFEVIGHYRYGRGISLSDGQLVVQGGNTNNQAANVALQVALSGNLFASLTSQAQGLVANVSPYPNPIDAIANLQPTDLQTSGFITPSTGGVPGTGQQITYGNTQTNFASLPVLGSPQVTGVFATVEASQLSMGLTLAEMTVVDAVGSQDGTSATQPQCMCLLGRSDLAFINSGYQVSNLSTTSPDNAVLPNANDFSTTGGGVSTTSSGAGTFPGNLNPADQAAYAASLQQGTESNPSVSPSIATMEPSQVQTIIDTYLWNLYSSLDGPHQTYESELRGGIYNAPQPGSSGVLGGQTTSSLGATAPPFSAAGAFVAGNPLAAVQMADSAAGNLSQAWNSFGQTLSNTVSIAAMSTQLAADQSNLATMQAELLNLQRSQAPGNVTVTSPPVADQIASLQASITSLQQKISNESGQISKMRAQVAAGPITPVTTPPVAFPPMGAYPIGGGPPTP